MELMSRAIPDEFKDYFNEYTQFEYYNRYKKQVQESRKMEDCFLCLKEVASSTPLVGSVVFGSERLGGGFYFRVNGVGIVVDPGIGFVSLMHANDVFIDDINIVIVTHDHLDHNADVKALASLLYDFNQNEKRRFKFFGEFFEIPENEHHIEWYMDASTIRHNEDYISKEYVHPLSEMSQDTYQMLATSIFMQVFSTEHVKKDGKYIDDTYGIKLKFQISDKTYIWGYTSDTRFFNQIIDNLKDSDVCILNLSDVYPGDVAGIRSKSTHLGYDGCVKIMERVQSKLFIISEFCCMNGDYRFEVVKALRQQLKEIGNDKRIFAAEKSMKVSIDGLRVACSNCGKEEFANKVISIRPNKEFGEIKYLCRNCVM